MKEKLCSKAFWMQVLVYVLAFIASIGLLYVTYNYIIVSVFANGLVNLDFFKIFALLVALNNIVLLCPFFEMKIMNMIDNSDNETTCRNMALLEDVGYTTHGVAYLIKLGYICLNIMLTLLVAYCCVL